MLSTRFSSTAFGPAEGVTTLQAVACRAVGSCVALGTYVGGSGRTDGAIDTLSGGTWGAANAPPPPGASTAYPYAYVHGAVCLTVGNCVAVGSYAAQDGGGQAVIETAAGK